MKDIIKISILRDGDKYAYMEYQTGNNEFEYNNTYGSTGFYDLNDVYNSIMETYAGETINVHINI